MQNRVGETFNGAADRSATFPRPAISTATEKQIMQFIETVRAFGISTEVLIRRG
jgi:hypothetical protein